MWLDFGDDDTGDPGLSPSTDWPVWPDPFLTGTVGFAVGTSRLSRWSLVFHTFAELGVRPQLTRSVDLTHDPDPG